MRFNIWDVIEKVEDWWPWHGQESTDTNVDPNLNPVLLIPGIGGSIINAFNDKGKKERIWVRLFAADHEFRSKLWSLYDKETGRTESLDPNVRLEVPEDRYGLYACDILDPNLILRMDVVYYFHDVIKQMLGWGYEEGTTLFGFPYDFRQSNRLPERMEGLQAKLKSMYEVSGGKKVNIVSHSMGGLIVKCFLALYPEFFEKYVNTWIAVTVPFQGVYGACDIQKSIRHCAPGFIMDSLLTGVEFVKGWQRELFIAKWSMHQLLIECPAIYELMASVHFNWFETPALKVWRKRSGSNGETESALESFGPEDCITIMMGALQYNTINYNGLKIPAPLNRDILEWAMETHRLLQTAKLPKGVNFYNVFGTGYETPLHVCYGCEQSPIEQLEEIPQTEGSFDCVDGDGTVPAESAMGDELDAKTRIGIPGDHRGILNDERLFRVLKHWLNAGEADPFYDPLNDYVILPTKAEFEKHKRQLVLIEQPEEFIVGDGNEKEGHVWHFEEEYIATITRSGSEGNTKAEAHAHVVKPCESGLDMPADKVSIEIGTVGVAEGVDVEWTATALDQAIAIASEEAIIANTKNKKTCVLVR